MTNSLAKQLRDLRIRAGNPPVRELERLIGTLQKRHPMARSTIQDKLSGRSPAKLSQVLSLVAAIAEYGRLNGAPLTPQEVDENSWRAKYVATMGNHGHTQQAGAPEATPASSYRLWNPEPLWHAGMTDLVDLVSQSKGAPPVTWVPHVASEMVQAQMSCIGLMEWVANGSAKDVVDCAQALNQAFPLPSEGEPDGWENWSPGYGATTVYLLRYAARVHGQNAPVIVVGLRRANLGNFVKTFLANIASWHLANNLDKAVRRLRSAELGADAKELLRCVGAERVDNRVIEVVHYFMDHEAPKDSELVLAGMAAGSPKRLLIALRDPRCDPFRQALLDAIPWSKRGDYVNALRGEGMNDIADEVVVPTYSDEPPF